MLELEYIAKCSYQLEKTPQGRAVSPQCVQASLPIALHAVSRKIAESGEYALQQTEATLTLTSGVAAFPSDMMAGQVDTVLHPDIDGVGTDQYLSRIPDGTRADLMNASGSFYPLYVIEKRSLYCSLGSGGWPDASDLPPNTEALKVTGSQIATLANLATQFDDDLILEGAKAAIGLQAQAAS